MEQGTLWRGAKPDPEGARWLIDHGVKSIVNLEMLHGDLGAFRKVSLAKPERYQLDYYRVADFELNAKLDSLEDKHVARMLAVVRLAPMPVYIHCRAGQNRTGIMVAAYKVLVEGKDGTNLDQTIKNAIEDMKGYKGIWFESDAKYISSLSSPEHRAAILRAAADWDGKIEKEAVISCEQGRCSSTEHGSVTK